MPRSLPHNATAPASNAAPDTSSLAPALRRLDFPLPEGPVRRLQRIRNPWASVDGLVSSRIIGPLIVNGILDHYVANKMPKEDAYPLILHIMCGLLVVGFLSNLMVRPVAEGFWLKFPQNVNIST
jgi:hypothetical protein